MRILLEPALGPRSESVLAEVKHFQPLHGHEECGVHGGVVLIEVLVAETMLTVVGHKGASEVEDPQIRKGADQQW